jgi:hypothetical protein
MAPGNGFKVDAASRRVIGLFLKMNQTRRDAASTLEPYFRNSYSRACGAPMAHEKTIAQSRDRQGADPLADARGSVRISIFETESVKS